MAEPRRIKNAYLWQNGMVMTFDQFGEQMPEYQGTQDEVWYKVLQDAPPDAIIQGGCRWPANRSAM